MSAAAGGGVDVLAVMAASAARERLDDNGHHAVRMEKARAAVAELIDFANASNAELESKRAALERVEAVLREMRQHVAEGCACCRMKGWLEEIR